MRGCDEQQLVVAMKLDSKQKAMATTYWCIEDFRSELTIIVAAVTWLMAVAASRRLQRRSGRSLARLLP